MKMTQRLFFIMKSIHGKKESLQFSKLTNLLENNCCLIFFVDNVAVSRDLLSKMRSCWRTPESRPTAKEFHDFFYDMYVGADDGIYVEN